MSRKLMVSTLVLASMTALAASVSLGGCQAEVSATAGTGASTPPPPPATSTPAPDPTPATTGTPAIKATKNVQIEGHQVKIPGEIEFDSGKAGIRETPAGTEVMNSLLEFIQANPQVTKLTVEGHTDNVPPKDKATTNQSLSQQRAENVVGWLVAKGIKKDRLTAAGLGDTKPKEKNDTDAHKQANRRTEFHIVEIDGKAVAATGGGTTAAGTGGAGSASAKPAASVPPKK